MLNNIIPVKKVKDGMLSIEDMLFHLSQNRYICLDDKDLEKIGIDIDTINKKDSYKINNVYKNIRLKFQFFNKKSLALFPNGMDLEIADVEQELTEENFFEIACISILNTNPRAILRSMRDLGNNRVAVKLFSIDNISYIYEIEKTGIYYSSLVTQNKNKIWANILIKAYAIHKHHMLKQGLEKYKYNIDGDQKIISKIELPILYFINTGNPSDVFKAILGSNTRSSHYKKKDYQYDVDDYRTYELRNEIDLLWSDYQNLETKLENLRENIFFEDLGRYTNFSNCEKKLYSFILNKIIKSEYTCLFLKFINACTPQRKKDIYFSKKDFKTFKNKFLIYADLKQKNTLEEFLTRTFLTINKIYTRGLNSHILNLKQKHENGDVIAFGTKEEFSIKYFENLKNKSTFIFKNTGALLDISQRNDSRNYTVKLFNNQQAKSFDIAVFFDKYVNNIYQGEILISFKLMNTIQNILYFLIEGKFIEIDKNINNIIRLLYNSGVSEEKAYFLIKNTSSTRRASGYKYEKLCSEFYFRFVYILGNSRTSMQEDYKLLNELLKDIHKKYNDNLIHKKFVAA